jgi:hypothetical protein
LCQSLFDLSYFVDDRDRRFDVNALRHI